MSHELLNLSLTELCDALHSKRVSATELMEIVLDRVTLTNVELNAVVAQRPRAEIPELLAAA